jgi:hypothetical protein
MCLEVSRSRYIHVNKRCIITVKLLPILKAMRRFDRPLTYWDPFEDEPPASWPDPVAAAAAREERGLPHRASEVTEDSAPRHVQEAARATRDKLTMSQGCTYRTRRGLVT